MQVNWATKIITIERSDSFMTLTSPNVYEMDVNGFRLALKDLEDDGTEGMTYLDTHVHNTEVILSGVTYARTFQIINGYQVEWEDDQYTVIASGANHNLPDVKVLNQVSLVSNNSAGLITVTSGSGVTEQDKLDIADRVWDEAKADHTTAGTMGERALDTENYARIAAQNTQS